MQAILTQIDKQCELTQIDKQCELTQIDKQCEYCFAFTSKFRVAEFD